MKYKYLPETTVQLKNNFLNCFDTIQEITCHPHPTLDLAILEFADADLRSLQVAHDAHGAAGLAAGRAHHLGALQVILRAAVRKIQPDDIHAGAEHLLEDFGIVRCRAERGHDLGAAGHVGSGLFFFAGTHSELDDPASLSFPRGGLFRMLRRAAPQSLKRNEGIPPLALP